MSRDVVPRGRDEPKQRIDLPKRTDYMESLEPSSTKEILRSIENHGFYLEEDEMMGQSIEEMENNGTPFASAGGLRFCKDTVLDNLVSKDPFYTVTSSHFSSLYGLYRSIGAAPGDYTFRKSDPGADGESLLVQLWRKGSKVSFWGGSHRHHLTSVRGDNNLWRVPRVILVRLGLKPTDVTFEQGGFVDSCESSAIVDPRIVFTVTEGNATVFAFGTREVVTTAWRRMELPKSQDIEETVALMQSAKFGLNVAYIETAIPRRQHLVTVSLPSGGDTSFHTKMAPCSECNDEGLVGTSICPKCNGHGGPKTKCAILNTAHLSVLCTSTDTLLQGMLSEALQVSQFSREQKQWVGRPAISKREKGTKSKNGKTYPVQVQRTEEKRGGEEGRAEFIRAQPAFPPWWKAYHGRFPGRRHSIDNYHHSTHIYEKGEVFIDTDDDVVFDHSKIILRAANSEYFYAKTHQRIFSSPKIDVEACEVLRIHPHPNIVQYLGCIVRDGRITGLGFAKYSSTLSQILEDGTPFSIAHCLHGIEAGIRHMHNLGLVHNDLNPSNIMMDGDNPDYARRENDLYSLSKIRQAVLKNADEKV
ncbi:hypothetical protein L249_2849 [Ophiocordyceps polyrhachis-furcata BCC 54312]|uniref:Protein kinase domain-containing protein n=1 Tax=Ophiocordyceps polyrhachis-furcata BCC 54312 TaxID=1330021 RepID=A0A367LPJ9_9HYPO|nr:hypothetical protein L249_2849 [Ophiocordyceps polyrhachis-furcata BCC 54312]